MEYATLTAKMLIIPPKLYDYLKCPAEIFGVALGRSIQIMAAPGWRLQRVNYGIPRYRVLWHPDPEVPLIPGMFEAVGVFWMQAPIIRIENCLSRGVLSAIPVQTPKPKRTK